MIPTALLDGKLSLLQSETGHRAGTDAILLAATVPDQFTGLLVDAGSASGAAGLACAIRVSAARVHLMEIDPKEAELARRNIDANGLADRAKVIEGDLLAPFKRREAMGMTKGEADRVISNPPYLTDGKSRMSPNEDRKRAHLMPDGGLDRWIVGCHAMLKPQGRLTLIHRADALADLLAAFKGRFGGVSILPIFAYPNKPATRLLIEGIKGSKAPLTLMPGLVLHENDGAFTPQAEALHRGLIALNLRH